MYNSMYKRYIIEQQQGINRPELPLSFVD
jgi:hypothetical protein